MGTMKKTVTLLVALAVASLTIGAVARATDEKDNSGCSLPQGDEPVTLSGRDFVSNVTNRWWPMPIGAKWTYEERDAESGAVEKIEVIVTDQTKVIAGGIKARVVRDTVRDEEGALVEDTFDWYAQDKAGNVWYLGEDTKEYENGVVTSTEGSFEHGVDGALAGIALPAHPEPGCAYRQEFYEGEAEDNGKILALDEVVGTPFRQFRKALSTQDATPLEPDMNEHKFYARDVGPVMTLQVSGGAARGVLVDYTRP